MAPAQNTADTVYHLHGSVVNGVTGRPIGRALVVSSDRRLATMTNAEGQFTLDVSVPAAPAVQATGSTTPVVITGANMLRGLLSGGISFSAQRPGYLPSRQGTLIALDATANTGNVVLRLLPAASIRGQITANGAESLRGLRVELLRRSVQDGRFRWQMAGVRPLSADGSFLITDLQPGEYTVATSEWSPQMFNLTATPTVSEQYPPDFLGDTRTLDGATKLHLGYGQPARANLHLHTAPYYSVTIPVQGLPPNSPVNVRVSSGTGFQLYQLGWNNRNGAVEGALPDGDYVVTVSTFGQQHAAAQIPLHVAGAAILHAPAGLTPTQDIPVSVRDERTQTGSGASVYAGPAQAQNSPGFFLSIRPEDTESGGGGMMQNTTNGPMLQNMMPGRYFVQGNAMGRGYIAAMTSDGVNLMTQALVVNDSGHTAPVEVTLRDDSGIIAGTVDFRSTGLQAARVLILPTDGSGHVLYSYVTSAGKFEQGNVPPGSYRVFAMPADQTDTLPYLDAQAMRTYDAKGGAVTVTAGQTAQVQAELVGLDGTGVQP
ncbi:hypothetical protein [Terriglobus sp.]|uniref:hypothetical protein n=1 Tax=Terriglobus sp. TaxID=1889013 RepID=UPI003B004219